MGDEEGVGAQVGGEVAVFPEDGDAGEEEVFEPGEAGRGVEEEAEEVGEGGVGDAVGGPGAVVVHFGDASGGC